MTTGIAVRVSVDDETKNKPGKLEKLITSTVYEAAQSGPYRLNGDWTEHWVHNDDLTDDPDALEAQGVSKDYELVDLGQDKTEWHCFVTIPATKWKA